MKICIAQNKPIVGDLPQNIENHLKLLKLTIPYEPDIVIFPELSIIGYDLEIALNRAIEVNDSRLDPFQKYSDLHSMTIGIGVPIQEKDDVYMSMILFRPKKSRELYGKKSLHPDEAFPNTASQKTIGLIGDAHEVALATCHEIAVSSHIKNVSNCGVKVYLASGAIFENGIEPALRRLSDIGNDYSLTVLMANSVGRCGENVCAGRSSIWDSNGLLLGQLDGIKEGILLIDTDIKKVITKTL